MTYQIIINNVYFIFLKLGIQTFAYLKPQKYANSEDINFSNILYSMFTLFRIATNEEWYFIVADCSRSLQSNFVCNDVNNYQDYQKFGQTNCGTLWAYPFFFSFYLLILLVFNLLVGVMIKVSGTIRKYEESSVNVYQLNDIINLWAEFDPMGSGYLNYKDFWLFSSRIAIILGVQIKDLLDFEFRKHFLKTLKLKIYEDVKNNNLFCVNFHEVILKFSRMSVVMKFRNVSMYFFRYYFFIITFFREDFEVSSKFLYRPLKERTFYKETHLTSEMVANFLGLKTKIQHWKRHSKKRRNK